MKTKYTKYTLKGEHPADEAQKALGDAASQGVVVRVDTSGAETNVYVAGDDTASTARSAADTKAAGTSSADVSESDITKIS